MNDFTKEELVLLRAHLEPSKNIDLNLRIYNLLNKLHFMIDNYCEHDRDYVRDSAMVTICKDCGKQI